MDKSLFLVIYPYKFTDFVYNLIELDEFKRYCDIEIWDISPITTPNFSKAVSAERSGKKGVIACTSWHEFIRRVYYLRRRSNEMKICILNEVTNTTFSEFFCNFIISVFLRKRNITVFDLYNGGVPLHYPDTVSNPSFLEKLLRVFQNDYTLSKIRKKLISAFLGVLARFIPFATKYRFVAGKDWESFAQIKTLRNRRINFVYGHSHDYSNVINNKKYLDHALPSKKIAVLLDCAGPMCGSDAVHEGRKVYFTSDVWYPALTRFFTWIEAETGVQIEIAGHYKSTHPAIAPCFGMRPVYYGKTAELVWNSEFVIAIASTAISYAVIFNKPVIFIYSNQLKEDKLIMRIMRGMAAILGKTPVNIDELPFDIKSMLTIDKERYQDYEKRFLTSNKSQRPNVQIILEDIMNINTGSDFAKASSNRMIN